MQILYSLWDNRYVRLIFIFIVCYILSNTFGSPLSRFDYIIILYIIYLPNISEENALPYALIFGLFYDLNYQIFLGVGVLLFMFLNFVKMQIYLMIDMNKLYSQNLFKVGIIMFYTLITLKFFGYPLFTFFQSFIYFVTMNVIALLVIAVFIGGRRAV